MLAFCTIPKAFEGHIGLIQKNAIASWKALDPEVEVYLCGDEEGAREAAIELGAVHVPQVRCNDFGIPYIDHALELVREKSPHANTCLINTDIILTKRFVEAVAAIQEPDFLLFGPKLDYDIKERIDFQDRAVVAKLEEALETEPHVKNFGSDYFVFPAKGAFAQMPSFVIGRAPWDNWMFFHARVQRLPVITTGENILAIHQNHDHAHVTKRNSDYRFRWEGKECNENRFRYLEYILAQPRDPKQSMRLLYDYYEQIRERFNEAESEELRAKIQPYLFFSDDYTHRMQADGSIQLRALAERLERYCEHADVLGPDTPLKNRFAHYGRKFLCRAS